MSPINYSDFIAKAMMVLFATGPFLFCMYLILHPGRYRFGADNWWYTRKGVLLGMILTALAILIGSFSVGYLSYATDPRVIEAKNQARIVKAMRNLETRDHYGL